MAFKMKFSGFKYDPYADQKAAKQDYYNKQVAAKKEYYDEQKGVEKPVEKKKFKDTKVGKFLGVGQGDKRKARREERKAERKIKRNTK